MIVCCPCRRSRSVAQSILSAGLGKQVTPTPCLGILNGVRSGVHNVAVCYMMVYDVIHELEIQKSGAQQCDAV